MCNKFMLHVAFHCFYPQHSSLQNGTSLVPRSCRDCRDCRLLCWACRRKYDRSQFCIKNWMLIDNYACVFMILVTWLCGCNTSRKVWAHVPKYLQPVHVKFTSKKGIFTFTFKLSMHQSLLDQNPTILIYHRSIIFWPIPLTLNRFRLCLLSLLFFSGSKNIRSKNQVPLQKGMSSGTEPSGLKLEFGKAKTLRTWHAVSWWWWWWNLIRRILGERSQKNQRVFFWKGWISEVKWGATWTPDFNLFQQKIKRGDGSILLKFCTLQFQNWINILYMYHILDVVLKSFTFQVLSKLCWKEWGRNTSTYS